MALARAIRAVVVNDTRRLLRDRFLVGTSVYIVGIALALRWLAPWLQAEILTATAFDITPYLPLGVSYFAVVNASVLTGMVGGFLLLETKEERTLTAMRVSPIPLAVPVGTLCVAVYVLGAAITVGLGLALGIGSPSIGAMGVAALVGAPTGIVMMLLLADIASNKVEAFAAMKMTSFLGLVPIGAYFLPEPWQFLAGVAPPYWACKIWWTATDSNGDWAWMAAAGFAVSGVWIAVLLRRFTR